MMGRCRAGLIGAICGLSAVGCALPAPRPEYLEVVRELHSATHQPVGTEAITPGPPPTPLELLGARPVDDFIRRALSENRSVQAARFNVLAFRSRIPQVTALEDPMVSNTIYPIPSVAPQYSLMGYNPYNLMLSQQFPWFGTLGLRGQAAEKEVEVALAELAAAELEAVASVKRAYLDLYFNQRAEAILTENRRLAGDFVIIASERYKTGGVGQQDVLRAEVAVDELDRELIRVRQGMVSARADLARQLHVDPDSELRTMPDLPLEAVPDELDRLYRLATAARPELKGRLAAIARDERAVELALKRYKPNVTVGLSYMDMEKTNAATPTTASGAPNVGLFVGFNLPIYQQKLAAGVSEAQARTVADAKLYEAERDSTYREIKDLITQANSHKSIAELFRSSILPKSRQALEASTSEYRVGNVDYVSLITAWREVLQVELQLAQVETELGKALASLERAVGCQLNEHPPATPAAGSPDPSEVMPVPPPAESPSPFRSGSS
ncbi:TolC family protein [Tundrisphaera lichenicola]|uniref:TolC family protein n=1 Tax=Tundrisphaera lichenicola TaxID=2029860 RepID=UPI003EC09DEE